jgi:hypothetical protein
VCYLVMDALLPSPRHGPQRPAATRAKSNHTASTMELVPRPRPILLPHGFEQVSVTCGLILFVVLVGRYVLRLRL